MKYEVEVIDADIPLLLGLDFLDVYAISIDLSKNKMFGINSEWLISLARK